MVFADLFEFACKSFMEEDKTKFFASIFSAIGNIIITVIISIIIITGGDNLFVMV
ncbi:MAG: hypothetical protein RR396_05030 [Clostridiales bacterium]